jgi:hypothetical protein
MNIVPFTKLFYGVHSSFYYQHRQHEEGVTIIESISSMRQGDPLRGPLFSLAHYRALLKTMVRTLGCVFPSMVNDIHIVDPMSEIVLPLPTFEPS